MGAERGHDQGAAYERPRPRVLAEHEPDPERPEHGLEQQDEPDRGCRQVAGPEQDEHHRDRQHDQAEQRHQAGLTGVEREGGGERQRHERA